MASPQSATEAGARTAIAMKEAAGGSTPAPSQGAHLGTNIGQHNVPLFSVEEFNRDQILGLTVLLLALGCQSGQRG